MVDDDPKPAPDADDEPAVTHEVQPQLELRPVPKLAEGASAEEILGELGRAVLFFDHSAEPVGVEDWEALK